jgi:hypothetical protein
MALFKHSIACHSAAIALLVVLPLVSAHPAEPAWMPPSLPPAMPYAPPIPPALTAAQRVNPSIRIDDELRAARDACLSWTPRFAEPGDAVGTWEARTCTQLITAGNRVSSYRDGLVTGIASTFIGIMVAVIAAALGRGIWTLTASLFRQRAAGSL